MELFKKVLKITGVVILITLASVGIGITGAAPISLYKGHRRDKNEPRVELINDREKEDQAELEELK